MPHQCVKCGEFYPDRSDEIIRGCTCGGKLFFYVKKGREDLLPRRQADLKPEEKARIESDVYDLIGDEIDRDRPIVLDVESIRIEKPGTYELDLVHLFHQGRPIIYKLEDGKYVIDLVETFSKAK